ncbi:hypothetical protein D9613_000834 [Agrocybe pediades]|uniref:Uncharacterized protein n=1 Tax=Agrocybe pediades TaxID=84607 RepID=A0A8H4VSE0_9AGAR|nr:hypothetical protein D9613_000834 [Agrocybe pediades]
MSFPLAALPLELGFEILRLAATPALEHDYPREGNIYANALALASVSFNVRAVIMPHLLHTVILSRQYQLNAFLVSISLQEILGRRNSRLHLDYTQLVRRIYSSECYEPFSSQPRSRYQDFSPVGRLMRNAESVGFHFKSIHLIYSILAFLGSPLMPDWNCRRVTFAGHIPRWNAITNSPTGGRFLEEITHFNIFAPHDDVTIPSTDPKRLIPNWFSRAPLNLMIRLTHLSFSLLCRPEDRNVRILIYKLPTTNPNNGATFLQWAASSDPLSHGKVVEIDVPNRGNDDEDVDWETMFYRGYQDIWLEPRIPQS